MAYKILLVEDESTMRRLMTMLLKRGGLQVMEAQDGKTAIEMALNEPPDLILLDIMMPVMDGFEVLRRLRGIPETDDIPVIFLSAKSQVEDRVEGLRLGADDFIVKPADPDELMARIEAVMARSRREYKRRKGKVFGFVGAKGGVGTSTALVNLGTYFQQHDQSTLLVDLHLAFGHLSDYLGFDDLQRTIADLVVMPPHEVDGDVVRRLVQRHENGLSLLPSPQSVPVGVTFSAEHLVALLEQAAYLASLIFVDLPLDPDIIEVVSEQLDGIVLVLGGEPSSLRAAEQVGMHLGRLGLHNRMSVLQVNRIQSEFQYVNGNMVNDRLGSLFLGSIPYKPELYLRADYNRRPFLVDHQGSSEEVVYEQIGNKILKYAEIVQQFQKRQTLESRHLS